MTQPKRPKRPTLRTVNMRVPIRLITRAERAYPMPALSQSLVLAIEAGLNLPTVAGFLERAIEALYAADVGNSANPGQAIAVAHFIERELRKALFS